MRKRLSVTLYPRQREIWLDDHLYRIIAGGERAGKSFLSAFDLVTRLPFGRRFWLVGPDYALPRIEFEYIEAFLWELGAIQSKTHINKPKEGSWQMLTKAGQMIMTRTSADVKKLAAVPVDGIILCEAGQQDYEAFLRAVGRVSETHGFVICSGTFESSHDWYAQLFRKWNVDDPDPDALGVAYKMPTWLNTFKFPGGRDDPKIKELEKLYAPIPGYFGERVGASPAPPIGVIFREFNYLNHISERAAFDKRLPVYLGVDPGHGGASAYAIAACQFVADPRVQRAADFGEEIIDPIDYCRVVDIIYIPGADFSVIKNIVREKYWFDHVAGGVIDIEAPDERKRWRTHLGIRMTSKKVRILEGERRLHSFLHTREGDEHPHLQFSVDVAASQGLREFMQYKSSVISFYEQMERPPTSAKTRRGPEHLLKALWYLLYYRYGPVDSGPHAPPWVRDDWASMYADFVGGEGTRIYGR